MKKLLFLTLVTLPAFCFAQTNYTIKGEVKGLKTGTKLFLATITDKKESIDSATVEEGKFSFRGTSDQPHLSYIFNGFYPGSSYKPSSDYKRIFIEEGRIKIAGKDQIKFSVVSGTKNNEELQVFADSMEALDRKTEALLSSYKTDVKGKTKEEKLAITEQFNKRHNRNLNAVTPVKMSFVKSFPNSPLSQSMLPDLLGFSNNLAFFDTLYTQMNEEVKNSKFGKNFLHSLNVRHKTAIGQKIIDFTQNNQQGDPVNLADFRKGNYVFIDFWASWCGPCRAENPVVVAAFNKYKSRNFDIIGVALENGEKGRAAWLKAIEVDGLPWTQVSDFKFWKNEVAVLYNIQAVPANFLINPDGIIIARNLRGVELEAKLAEIFK